MEVSEIIRNICMLNEKLSATLIENCQLRRDILLLEEELNAHRASKTGTKVVYKVTPKPNEVYTDEEPIVRKKYNWHR